MQDVGREHRTPLKNSPLLHVTGAPAQLQDVIKDLCLTVNQKGDGCCAEHGENAEKTVGKAHLEA